MTHIVQPSEASCVQSCLAMYFGVPLDRVFEELPDRKSGTKHRAMIDYLHRHGVRCADRMTSARGQFLPGIGLVRITWPNKKGHIVLKIASEWHDPLLDKPFFAVLPVGHREWSGGGRITSFLALERVS